MPMKFRLCDRGVDDGEDYYRIDSDAIAPK